MRDDSVTETVETHTVGMLYRLPEDTRLTPVTAYTEGTRVALDAEMDDEIVSRAGAREGDQLVSADVAQLLRRFATPCTIAKAVLEQAGEDAIDPELLLEQCFPVLESLASRGFLIREDAPPRQDHTLAEGTRFLDRYEVVGCLSRLEDTEVLHARMLDGEGDEVVIKIGRKATPRLSQLFAREAAILRHLNGAAEVPAYIDHGVSDDRFYLIMSRFEGDDPVRLCTALRRRGMWHVAIRVCLSITQAFGALLARGVLHGDIHPGNVLVDERGVVRIVDLAQARTLDGPLCRHATGRGAVDAYYEPEMAAALQDGTLPPPATEAGQQYAVAAIVYRLLTGMPHLDLPAHRENLFEAVMANQVRPIPRGLPTRVATLDPVIRRALSGDPADRYDTFAAFAEALAVAADAPAPHGPPIHPSSRHDAAGFGLDWLLARFSKPDPRFLRGRLFQPLASVNFGAAGLAHAFNRAAEIHGSAHCSALAAAWIHASETVADRPDAFFNEDGELTSQRIGAVTPYHTASGLSLVGALIAAGRGRADGFSRRLEDFAKRTDRHCPEWDLTLGWAGVTLALVLMRQGARRAQMDTAVVDSHLEFQTARLRRHVDGLPRPAQIGDDVFLGVAHGQAGQLYALLVANQALGRPLQDDLVARLDEIAALAVPIGAGLRWPRTGAHFKSGFAVDSFGGWCNGSAGYAMTFAALARLTGREDHIRAAERAALDAWSETIDYHDLCCGAGGAAYAQLTLHRLTGDQSWLARAAEMRDRAIESMGRMTPSFGLYKGAVGVSLLCLETAYPERARMPLFEID